MLLSRSAGPLNQLRDQYGADKVEVLAGDLSDFSIAGKAVELANSRFGRLDALIVNHGALDPVKKVAEATAEEWRRAFDINVFSALSLVSTPLIHTLLCSTRAHELQFPQMDP